MARQVGDRVTVRARFGGQVWTGVILKRKINLLGFRYLVQYRVHDLDYDYHYTTTKWYGSGRLI